MKTTNRFRNFEGPEIPERAQNAIETAQNASSSFSELRDKASDLFEGSKTSPISSLVDKYKGPDSIELPQRSTRVDKYQGPDSLSRPEIESEVEKYKGPKQLFDERGSRVEKYKGPDDAKRQIFPQPDVDGIIAAQKAKDDSLRKKINENK
jgi:hypothetical protein